MIFKGPLQLQGFYGSLQGALGLGILNTQLGMGMEVLGGLRSDPGIYIYYYMDGDEPFSIDVTSADI